MFSTCFASSQFLEIAGVTNPCLEWVRFNLLPQFLQHKVLLHIAIKHVILSHAYTHRCFLHSLVHSLAHALPFTVSWSWLQGGFEFWQQCHIHFNWEDFSRIPLLFQNKFLLLPSGFHTVVPLPIDKNPFNFLLLYKNFHPCFVWR